MKEKVKKIIFGYLPGFVLGVITAISISVIAATYFPSNDVTYDNKESGLSSTDVQGAIDELYLTCTAEKVDVGGKDVIVVDKGDGLYKDEYEEGKYTYKGANPNNYVTFNNEKAGWRIISINSDGTIKIMKDAIIGNIAWDSSGSYGNNNWARPADLNTYLNETYLNSLNSKSKTQIIAHNFSIGSVAIENNDLEDQINDENSKVWKGKIALPTLSEYLRANSNKEQCGTFSLNNSNYSTCKNTTWMYINDIWWTLSPRSDFSYSVFTMYGSGLVGNSDARFTYVVVRPAITLSSKVQITGGMGTESDPYILS